MRRTPFQKGEFERGTRLPRSVWRVNRQSIGPPEDDDSFRAVSRAARPQRIHYSTLIRRSKRIFQIGYAPNRRGGRISECPRTIDPRITLPRSLPLSSIGLPTVDQSTHLLLSGLLSGLPAPIQVKTIDDLGDPKMDRDGWKKKECNEIATSKWVDGKKKWRNEERGRRHGEMETVPSMVKPLGNEIGQTRRFRRREETGAAKRRGDG